MDAAPELIESLMRIQRGPKRRLPKPLEMLTARDMIVFTTMKKLLDEGENTDCIALSEIGKHLDISKPALTQNINRLEDKNLVERVVLKSDRRATYIRFTGYGQELFKKEKACLEEFMGKVVEKMGEKDTRRFVELMNKFERITQEVSCEFNEKERNSR